MKYFSLFSAVQLLGIRSAQCWEGAIGWFEWMKIIFSTLLRECKNVWSIFLQLGRLQNALAGSCVGFFITKICVETEQRVSLCRHFYFRRNLKNLYRGTPSDIKILRLQCWWNKVEDKLQVQPGTPERTFQPYNNSHIVENRLIFVSTERRSQ